MVSKVVNIHLLDPETSGLRPEAVCARTPFVLIPPGTRNLTLEPPDRASPNFLGWSYLYMGLRASAAQRRQGIWLHSPAWAWQGSSLDVAKSAMADVAKGEGTQGQHSSRYGVALLLVPVTVQRLRVGELYAVNTRGSHVGAGSGAPPAVANQDSLAGLRLRPVAGLTLDTAASANGGHTQIGSKALHTLARLQWLVPNGVLQTANADTIEDKCGGGESTGDISLEPSEPVVGLWVKRYSRAKKDSGWVRQAAEH